MKKEAREELKPEVYCEECDYLRSRYDSYGDYYEGCAHPATLHYEHPIRTPKSYEHRAKESKGPCYLGTPEEINANNDCSLFMPLAKKAEKAKKSFWRKR